MSGSSKFDVFSAFRRPSERLPASELTPLSNSSRTTAHTPTFLGDFFERYEKQTKKYLSLLGRLLIVSTFFEDAVRVVLQWKNQVAFIHEYEQYSMAFAVGFLAVSTISMVLFSTLILCSQRFTRPASLGLIAIIVLQSIVYSVWTEFDFVMRHVSMIGGLLILLAEDYVRMAQAAQKITGIWSGIHVHSGMGSPGRQPSTWLSLFGRVLLLCLFSSLILAGEMTALRLGLCAVCAIAGFLVLVGIKTKYSAAVLLAVLSLSNILVNNWWSLDHTGTMKDFLRFDFFQTLSVTGGLMLLMVTGPGYYSVDEKKAQ